ncbi:MAG: GNAT family N-acetyltransferase [Thermoplasmata archaeon]
MRPSDIAFAMKVTEEEGWGFLRSDIQRLLRLSSGGVLIAIAAGRPVGLVSVIRHGEIFWIGNLVVSRRWRGCGVGRVLMEAAMSFVKRRGGSRVGLFSYPETVGFYTAFGFKAVGRFFRFCGRPRVRPIPLRSGRIVPLCPNHFPEVIALDRRAWGEGRGRMMSALVRDFKRHSFVWMERGKVKGFIIGKPGREYVEAGPWVCAGSARDAARSLFLALCTRASKGVEVYVPANSAWVVRFLRSLGLRRQGAYIEMAKGRARETGKCLELISPAGVEKG